MSSVLNRKKKKMQPLGYTKQELVSIQNYARKQSKTNPNYSRQYMRA